MKLNIASLFLFLGLTIGQVAVLPAQTNTPAANAPTTGTDSPASGVPNIPAASTPAAPATTTGALPLPGSDPAVPPGTLVPTDSSPIPLPMPPVRPSPNADGSPMTDDVVVGKNRNALPAKTFMKGVVTEYTPGMSLSIKAGSQPSAMRLTISKLTTMVDSDGNPADASALAPGAMVSVECVPQGPGLVLEKVILPKVTKPTVAAAAGTSTTPMPTEKTGITTATVDSPDVTDTADGSTGVVTELLPGSILMIRNGADGQATRYVYDKNTVIVDENGNTVDMSAIKRDIPVRVETAREGKGTVVRRVTVQKTVTGAPAVGAPAIGSPATGSTPNATPATGAPATGAIPNAAPATGGTPLTDGSGASPNPMPAAGASATGSPTNNAGGGTGAAVSSGTGGTKPGVIGSSIGAAATGANPNNGGNGVTGTGAAVSNGTGGIKPGVIGSSIGAAATGASPNNGGNGVTGTGAAVSNGTGGTGANSNNGGANNTSSGGTVKGPAITGDNQGGGGNKGGGSANPTTGQ